MRVGDVLVCAGTSAYLGPFTSTYRNSLVSDWLAEFAREKLPVAFVVAANHLPKMDIMSSTDAFAVLLACANAR